MYVVVIDGKDYEVSEEGKVSFFFRTLSFKRGTNEEELISEGCMFFSVKRLRLVCPL